MSRRPSTAMLSHRRLNAAMLVAVVVGVTVMAHAALLDTRFGERLDRAAERRDGLTAIESFRGAIFDRNGVALAMTRPSIQIGVDLRVLSRELAASEGSLDDFLASLAKELGLERDELRDIKEKLEVPTLRGQLLYRELAEARDFEARKQVKKAIRSLPRYVSLLRRQSPGLGRVLRRLKTEARRGKKLSPEAIEAGAVPGTFAAMVIEPRPQRSYPEGVSAAKLIGFTSQNLDGVEGIERAMNHVLSPRRQLVRGARDRRRRFLPDDEIPVSESLAGGDVYITIDQRIQGHMEAMLVEQVARQEAEGAAGLVMDARSGAVLAMASVPMLDDAKPKGRAAKDFLERVAFFGYDLGSTVKPFVVAKALDDGAIRHDQTMECDNGRIMIPGKRRPTFDHHKMDKCTVTEIIAHSSNVGTVKIGRITGLNVLRDYFETAGLTRTPPLGLGRPPRGALPRKRNGRLASRTDGEVMLFGYALRGSLLSIGSAYTAFANGGIRVNPFLVDRVVKGELEEVAPRGTRERIMSAEAAARVLPMLREVVHGGKHHPARVPGLEVAGKTGTSQKFVRGLGYHGHRKRFASFVGLVPYEDPQYVIAVMVDAPKDRYGAMAAGPVFRQVAHFVMSRIAGRELPPLDGMSEAALAVLAPDPEMDAELGVAAEQIGDILRGMENERRQDVAHHGALPDFVGLDARSALSELAHLKLPVSIEGSGVVVGQVPRAETPVSEIHGAVHLRLGQL